MGKRGRPRKAGPRTPSGKLSRAKGARVPANQNEDPTAVALAQPHRRWLPADKARDQRAESELGRLYLAGQISETECEAGEKWRRLMIEFHHIMAAPLTPQSPGANMAAAGNEKPAESSDGLPPERPETDEERRTRVLVTMGRAQRRIGMCIGAYGVFRELDAVVMRDQPVGNFLDLLVGLRVLVRMWRLGEQGGQRIRSEVGERPEWAYGEAREVHFVGSDA